MLTPDKLKEAAAALRELDAAYNELGKARHRLALVNEFGKQRGEQSSQICWPCKIVLKKDESWRNEDIVVTIRVPFPQVQQQMVDELNAAIRKVVLLGGDPSAAGSE